MPSNGFRTCGWCATNWKTKAEFLADSQVILSAFKADTTSPDRGMVQFTHNPPPCGATIVIPIRNFFHLYKGPRYSENLSNTPACPRKCMDVKNLSRCPVHCSCAHARETAIIVKCCLESARGREKLFADKAAASD